MTSENLFRWYFRLQYKIINLFLELSILGLLLW